MVKDVRSCVSSIKKSMNALYLRPLSECSFEQIPGPLQGVLDLVGEVLEGADRDGLLGRILGRAIRLG